MKASVTVLFPIDYTDQEDLERQIGDQTQKIEKVIFLNALDERGDQIVIGGF